MLLCRRQKNISSASNKTRDYEFSCLTYHFIPYSPIHDCMSCVLKVTMCYQIAISSAMNSTVLDPNKKKKKNIENWYNCKEKHQCFLPANCICSPPQSLNWCVAITPYTTILRMHTVEHQSIILMVMLGIKLQTLFHKNPPYPTSAP